MKKEAHDLLKNRVLRRNQKQLQQAKIIHKLRDDPRIDRIGQPITFAEWSILAFDKEYFTIGEEVFDGIRLLTIWIGREDCPYTTLIFEDEELRAISAIDTENEAQWLHARLIFMIEQKIWSFDE